MQIEHKQKPDAIDTNRIYTIGFNVAEIKKELNMQRFEDVLKAIETLQDQKISYKSEEEDGVWTNSDSFIMSLGFLQDKRIRIKITGAVLQFLTLLNRSGYTKIIKEVVLSLKSKYSIRLLELSSKINQQANKTREYELKEFAEMIDFNIVQARGNSKLKKILDDAQKELNEKSKLTFEYELLYKSHTLKSGRPSVTHIKIIAKSNQA